MQHLIFAIMAMLVMCSQALSAPDIAGEWESNQGPMTITANADGTFTVTFSLIKGTVVGALDGDVFKGNWVRFDDRLADLCKTEKDGSPYWGGFKVTFYYGPDFPEPSFQGGWTFCGDEVRFMNWTGARPKK
ncbi:MAG: hypothetical protein ACRCS9_10420 [Hyphomicrobium sp.]